MSCRLGDLPSFLGQPTALLGSLSVPLSWGLFILVFTSIPSVTPAALPFKAGEPPTQVERLLPSLACASSQAWPLPDLSPTTKLGLFPLEFLYQVSLMVLDWTCPQHLASIQRGEDRPQHPARPPTHTGRGSGHNSHPTGKRVGSQIPTHSPGDEVHRPLRLSHWGLRGRGSPCRGRPCRIRDLGKTSSFQGSHPPSWA